MYGQSIISDNATLKLPLSGLLNRDFFVSFSGHNERVVTIRVMFYI